MKRARCVAVLLALITTSCGRSPAPSPSSGSTIPRSPTTTSTPNPVASPAKASTSSSPTGSDEYTLVRACTQLGGRLRTETLTLEMPSGAVTVVENAAITGEMYATVDDAAPMRALVADPSFETLLSEPLSAELHGEGIRCTLTFTRGGKSRTQKWSSQDKPTTAAATAKQKLGNAFALLATKAKATRYGGDCATDSDCHFAGGADCRCHAAGPPPTAGQLSRCLADPCGGHEKPRCEQTVHRCVLGKRVAAP